MGPMRTLRAQMGPMTGPASLKDPLRCRKRLVAREVYWQFLKPLGGNSKNTMVGMRLIFPFAQENVF
jgi:hypothetical protein